MSSPVTTQETSSRGSYLSVAASITAKFKCCVSMDETHTTHTQAHNTNADQPPIAKSTSTESIDLEMALETLEPKNA